MLHLLDFINIFGLICGFCNFLFLLSLNSSLKVNKKHTCFQIVFFFNQDISFAINDLERWLFSLLTCLLLIHACYNFLFLVSMKGQHKNVFALLVVSARASPFTKLGFGGGGVKFSFRVISPVNIPLRSVRSGILTSVFQDLANIAHLKVNAWEKEKISTSSIGIEFY